MMHLQLAAAMMGGLEDVQIKPGTKLLYLGAASGTTVSHCSDLVGPVDIFSNHNDENLTFSCWLFICQVLLYFQLHSSNFIISFAGRHRLCSGVLAPLGPRPAERLEEAAEHRADRGGRASPAQVPHAGWHGRHHLLGCGSARSG